MKIKMTHSDIANNRLAGLVYDLPQTEAQKYLDEDKAILHVDIDYSGNEPASMVNINLKPKKKVTDD